MDQTNDQSVPLPELARAHVAALLASRRHIDRELANYLAGILVANGIDGVRLRGLDEDAMTILLD